MLRICSRSISYPCLPGPIRMQTEFSLVSRLLLCFTDDCKTRLQSPAQSRVPQKIHSSDGHFRERGNPRDRHALT
jgi:hypothetical protein